MLNKRVLIVGAGIAGQELIDQLKHHTSLGYQILGLVDDDPQKLGRKIKSVPVIGQIFQLESLIKDLEIESVFIAIPSANGSLIRKIINSCQKAKVTFRIIPRTLELVQGKVHMESIRSVTIDDILGRAILQSEQPALVRLFQNKRILITGSAGSIGSELARQIAQFSPRLVVLFDWWENGLFELEQELLSLENFNKRKIKIVVGNIQDDKKIEWVLNTYRPEIVFHAAAFKHVPLMESHPEEAVKDNIIGTNICAKLAGEHKIKRFVFISTDKAVNPTSVMGATKSFAELLIRYYNDKYQTRYSSVRFGNVLGSNGSVVKTFQKQIAVGGPLTVTSPRMTRFFMSIPEAVQLILQAARMGQGGEIFVLDMGAPVKIIELAKTMIRLAGFEPETEIPIQIIGRRPGEKVFEEVLTKDEKVRKTEHPLIFTTKNILKITDRNLWESFEKLMWLASQQNRRGIIKELVTILPTYRKRR